MSIVLASASRLLILRCRRTDSEIWSPTVSTGLSDVIGSWKIIAISLPRILRISGSVLVNKFWPRSEIEPPSMRPGGIGIKRMIESALTDLPEPDSPTMPSVEPLSTEYESPFTAPTKPSSVLKPTRRSLTSRIGKALRFR